MEYKVSCIVPIYNMEKYIYDMIRSLRKQTIGFKNIEIILVDDKSKDKSREIIKKLDKKFKNIKGILLEKNNGGPSIPKNIGVSHATGEYIIFLDPDDCLPQDAYEKLYNIAKKTNDDFVMGNIKKFNSEKCWIQPQMNINLLQRRHISINIKDKPEFLTVLGYMVTKMFKREFYIKNNFQFNKNINLGEDYLLGVEIFIKSKTFTYIPECVYLYRETEGESLTKMNPKDSIENFLSVNNEISSKIKQGNFIMHIYQNLVKSIIYRLNEQFLELEYEEKKNILLQCSSIFEKFEYEDKKGLSNHEKGIINIFKSKNYDLLLRFIEMKVERDIKYASFIEVEKQLENNKAQRQHIVWKKTKKFREIIYNSKRKLA